MMLFFFFEKTCGTSPSVLLSLSLSLNKRHKKVNNTRQKTHTRPQYWPATTVCTKTYYFLLARLRAAVTMAGISSSLTSMSAMRDGTGNGVWQQEEHEDDGHSHEVIAVHHLCVPATMNKGLGRRLARLQRDAMIMQYHIAVLSTLGGAHHLCNKPETALVLACQQEAVARRLGSSSLLVRSKVFQAVNLGLLGQKKQSRALFRNCDDLSRAAGWTDMASFVDASRHWLVVELRLTKEQRKKNTQQQEQQQGIDLPSGSSPLFQYSDLADALCPGNAATDTRNVHNARFPSSKSVEELAS